MLTKKSKYALKALIRLGEQRERGPILISELADCEAIPKKFLEIILLELKHHGVLASRKGKGGGYYLSRPPEQVSIGRVIRIIDGPLALIPCVSQTAYARCDECRDEKTCSIRMVMQEVRDATSNILDQTTLADMIRREQRARSARTETEPVQVSGGFL